MFGNSSQLRCCDAYLRSAAARTREQSASTARGRSAGTYPRVLIVEFRDEVFAALKSLLEENRCQVGRAVSGRDVATEVKRFAPDLVLVNEGMPGESGWLITCKLRLVQFHAPVWLYAGRKPRPHADWKELCGVDEVLAYGGVLRRLDARIRERLSRWLVLIDQNAGPIEAAQAAAAGLGKCA